MDIGSIFLILSLALLVAMFVARPFMESSRSLSNQEEQEISSLLAQREGILRALQELDFDYTLGKIPEDDYPVQRKALLARGAEILRRLDALAPQKADGTSEAEAVTDRLEAAIAARRQATVPAGDVDDPLEAAIAARRRARQDKAVGFCTQCGAPLQRSDRFCPRCGTPAEA
ncbi:MAG: zinc ribbon domain-containing protein [Anaerolineae bacterium]|nr:MAG: zinc ribbon domain-containing protein [Anaerolineae bacterium]